ncbi:MAG TPA: hypothetical protein VL172_03605 [Kofleriaceae bacterium]|nr:hypothetical protein [Kofleriaceae bacterium]
MNAARANLVLAVALLAGCPGGDSGVDPDLGAIDDTLTFADRVNWPGVDRASGRVVPAVFGFAEDMHIVYWFLGFASKRTADSFWFCRQGDAECPLDAAHRFNWDHIVGHPLFTRIPGQLEFSPFWQMWRVDVPPEYQADEIKTTATLDARAQSGELTVQPLVIDFGDYFGEPAGFQEVVAHCALVLAGTTLEFNGTEMADGSAPMMRLENKVGWHEGYRVEFVDFSRSDGVFPESADSQNRPLMRLANIYIQWRMCAGDNPPAICALPGTIAERRPVSERGLGEDITNDGDASDTNNTFAGFPCKQPLRAEEKAYSPLWAVNNVFIDGASPLAEIDVTADQRTSEIKSAVDVFDRLSFGDMLGPEPSVEDETGNPVPGNEGQVFFNCPLAVPADHIPFPCEANP